MAKVDESKYPTFTLRDFGIIDVIRKPPSQKEKSPNSHMLSAFELICIKSRCGPKKKEIIITNNNGTPRHIVGVKKLRFLCL